MFGAVAGGGENLRQPPGASPEHPRCARPTTRLSSRKSSNTAGCTRIATPASAPWCRGGHLRVPLARTRHADAFHTRSVPFRAAAPSLDCPNCGRPATPDPAHAANGRRGGDPRQLRHGRKRKHLLLIAGTHGRGTLSRPRPTRHTGERPAPGPDRSTAHAARVMRRRKCRQERPCPTPVPPPFGTSRSRARPHPAPRAFRGSTGVNRGSKTTGETKPRCVR